MDWKTNPSLQPTNCQYCNKEVFKAVLSRHENACMMNSENFNECPVCGKHIHQKRKFCSHKCAGESKRKHPIKTKVMTPKDVGIAHKINLQNKYLNMEWDDLPDSRKRIRLLQEQEGRCDICNNYEWLGKPINLHYHHKDGNNKNNSRENVQFACPNCHSFTDTYCGHKQKLPQYEYLKTTKIEE